MTAILATLIGLPRWVKLAAIGSAIVALLLTLHQCAVSDAVEADRAEAVAVVLDTARDADEAAYGEIEAVQTEIEQGNQDAREAAAVSDDPLKSAFDSLRARATPDRPPAP